MCSAGNRTENLEETRLSGRTLLQSGLMLAPPRPLYLNWNHHLECAYPADEPNPSHRGTVQILNSAVKPNESNNDAPTRSYRQANVKVTDETLTECAGLVARFGKTTRILLPYFALLALPVVARQLIALSQHQSPSPDKVGRLYHEAAENLRDCHGVASITPASLQQTVTLLNVPPRRLVAQGLAPRWKRQHQHPALEAPTDFFEFQDINAAGGREITPETVNDDSDLMSDYEYFSDNEYEGFEGEEDDDSTASAASTSEDIWVHGHGKTKTASTSAERDATMFVTSSFTPLDDNQQPKACRNNANISPATTKVEQDAAAVWGDKASFGLPVPVDHAASDKVTDKTPIHDALLAGGVNVSPQETGALLHALGVDPERLVLLGLIKRELMTPTGTAAPPVKTRGPLGRPTPGHRTIRVSVRLAGSKRGPQTRDGGGDTRKGGVGSRALFGSTSCPQLAVAPLPEMTVRKMRNLVAHGSGFAQRTHERRIGGPASRSYVQVRTCSGHEVRAAFRRRLSSTNLLNL